MLSIIGLDWLDGDLFFSLVSIFSQIKKILAALIILIPLIVALIWRRRIRKVQERENEIADS